MIHLPGREPKTRRLKRIDIQGDLLLDILRGQDGTRLLRTEDIPADAKVVGFTVDQVLNTITVYVESEVFGEVEEAQLIPHLAPAFTAYYADIEAPDKLIFTVGAEIVNRELRNREQRFEKVRELVNAQT